MCIRALPCRSPDERQRNPGPPFTFQKSFPDFTAPVIGPARGPHRARAMGCPDFGSDPLVHPGYKLQRKGGGTPADAIQPLAASSDAARVRRDALACRRSTAALAAASQRRRSAPARASWDAVGAHSPDGSKDRALLNGRYPRLPVPVQRAPRRPVIVPAGRIPRAARERGYKPRPQEPHSLHRSAVAGDVPSMSEIQCVM
jgi:hypothetical protein